MSPHAIFLTIGLVLNGISYLMCLDSAFQRHVPDAGERAVVFTLAALGFASIAIYVLITVPTP